MQVNIISITYRSTNYYVLDNGQYRLLIDAGWPGSLGEFKHALQVKGVTLADIDYILVTHYHPDHAGLAQDIKNAGAKLIIISHQQSFIPLLKTLIKPGTAFVEIINAGNIIIPVSESRAFLYQLGFNGEVVCTPSHSEDSITLVLNSGEAFIGDLAPAHSNYEGDNSAQKDWEMLHSIGVKRVYPGHAGSFTL